MKVKLVQRKNPQDQSLPGKYYVSPINEGRLDLEDIAAQISGRSSVTHGDILNVLQNFIEVIPLFLMMGKSVNLGKLATLRVSLSSEGVDDPADFHTNMITTKRIIFTPGVKLKDQIDKIKFETVK